LGLAARFRNAPYFRLTIEKPSDVVAFVSLAVCGLIAAPFGKRRERWSAVARRAGDDLDIVRVLVWQLRGGAPLEETLETLRQTFRLRAIALRGPDERFAGRRELRGRSAAGSFDVARSAPARTFRATSRPNPDRRQGNPAAGRGRQLRLRGNAGEVATTQAILLDLWGGNGEELSAHEIRALSIAASVLALELSHRRAA